MLDWLWRGRASDSGMPMIGNDIPDEIRTIRPRQGFRSSMARLQTGGERRDDERRLFSALRNKLPNQSLGLLGVAEKLVVMRQEGDDGQREARNLRRSRSMRSNTLPAANPHSESPTHRDARRPLRGGCVVSRCQARYSGFRGIRWGSERAPTRICSRSLASTEAEPRGARFHRRRHGAL